MTMEWAREVDIGTEGRMEGVQGPVVTMIVEAGRECSSSVASEGMSGEEVGRVGM